MIYRLDTGKPFPLGTTPSKGGVNFSLYSRHATSVYIELFDDPDGSATSTFRLSPDKHRTGDLWHAFIHGAKDQQLYGYRVDGPFEPEVGHRFNRNKLLSDPYAKYLVGQYASNHPSIRGDKHNPDRLDESDSAPHTVRSIALTVPTFDWQGHKRPKSAHAQRVIYELHVKGFTRHPSAHAAHPGTYAALADQAEYLSTLGVTTVELLPCFEFDRNEPVGDSCDLVNYWGYSPLNFFCPHRAYCVAEDNPYASIDEFRNMIRELHRAGLEVILDVVYNHTGEGNNTGPTLSFRGLENSAYYLLDKHSGAYQNQSGCGNTFNCSHPMSRQLIIDSLRYWHSTLGVDGFRFDLSVILGRDHNGHWVENRNLLHDIAEDPILRHAQLISETWDAAGLYQVGRLPNPWAEWNDRFRDDTRRFTRGDFGQTASLAFRVGGSADTFAHENHATRSINFITAHDGFTLRDLVSYERKHNEDNRENNRDGTDSNYSYNWGIEGDSSDRGVERIRIQHAKNLLLLLLCSRGTPMLTAGDERWRTQRGNNNAYCQDNIVSWIDWAPTAVADEMTRFVRYLIRLRQSQPALHHPEAMRPVSDSNTERGIHDNVNPIRWHGVKPNQPDFSYHSRSIVIEFAPLQPGNARFLLILNAWTDTLSFDLPEGDWRTVVQTELEPPDDIHPIDGAPESRSPLSVPPFCAFLLAAATAKDV